MLYDIIKRLSEDTGVHLEQQRTDLVNLVHRAAEPLYRRLECNAIMREVTVLVPSNQVITVPSYIGPMRGLRESVIDNNFALNTMMAPRFVKNDWQYKWKNWRELPGSAIYTDLDVVAPLTITVSAVEGTGVTVHIIGQTNTGQRIEEEVVMDATSKTTTNSFGPNIFTIACFDERQYDISIQDDNDQVVAILYNNENKTHYRKFDVSEFNWSKDVSDGTTTVDLLYKHPYWKMLNDADEFPADGYEDAIYFAAMALWAVPQQGKESMAAAYMQQSLIEPIATKNSEEEKQVKKLQFERHPLYNQIRRRYYHIPVVNTPRT